MKNINDLRTTLFQTMQDVRTGKIDKDHAKLVVDLGQVLVNTAKVEVDYIKVTNGASGTGFVELVGEKSGTEVVEDPDELPDGITRIIRHRITG